MPQITGTSFTIYSLTYYHKGDTKRYSHNVSDIVGFYATSYGAKQAGRKLINDYIEAEGDGWYRSLEDENDRQIKIGWRRAEWSDAEGCWWYERSIATWRDMQVGSISNLRGMQVRVREEIVQAEQSDVFKPD